tara:strand:+ start:57 stop:1187 length:1131 start_codon:yes stop_codon:yes gene_type:complete
MLDQEKILNLIKTTGPTIPSKVAKIIKTDILLASAHLADLVSQGKLRLSNLKIGGSPLYYLFGQEDQLYPFAAGNINPKDQRVLEILKSNRVLREVDLDLLSKVALRSLKDFAIPLRVTVEDKKEIFWKWYLLGDEETNLIIRSILTPPQPIQKQVLPEEIELKEEVEEKLDEIKNDDTLDPSKLVKSKAKSKPKLKPKKIHTNEKQKKLSEKIDKKVELINKEIKLKEGHPVDKKLNDSVDESFIVNQEDKSKNEPIEEIKKPKKRKMPIPDEFLPLINNLFDSLDISIEHKEIIRKNSEIDLIIKVPAVIDKLTYFCKAKNKKRCDEKDLSSAYMEAQIKKLPLLFLYSNSLNKKAQEMLDSGAFQNVTVKKIE